MKDFKIGRKYLQKSNIVFTTNYYQFLILMGASSIAFMFLNTNYFLMGLGVVLGIGYFLMYGKRNDQIVTSVTVYKFSDIFVEVLKSIRKTKGKSINFKKMFKKK